MNQKFSILFIDDELNSSDETQANVRVELVQILNKDKRFDVTSFHPVDFIKNNGEIGNKNLPDLIIIDYKLSGGGNRSSEKYYGTGYSMTSFCKERFSEVPCYLISQLIDEDISIGEHYDKKISHGFLTKPNGRDVLASDCLSYKQLKSDILEYSNGDLIIKTLQVPIEEKDSIKLAIPSEFWNELAKREPSGITDSESLLIKFTKWVNSTLLVRKGPLLNLLDLATLFGVEKNHFENEILKSNKFKEEFKEIKYNGIFCDSFSDRWWAQKSYNLAVSFLNGEGGSDPWRKIPNIIGVDNEFWSKCPVCDKHYPETVALDKESGKYYPCHWSCCIGGELSDDIVGFEPLLYLDV